MKQKFKTKIFKHILMLLGFSATAITQFACAYGPLPNDYDAAPCESGTAVSEGTEDGGEAKCVVIEMEEKK